MLPPFIIDQIRRLEEEQRRDRDRARPRLELPIERHLPNPEQSERAERRDRSQEPPRGSDKPERGVVVLDV